MRKTVEINISLLSPNRRVILSEETILGLCQHLRHCREVDPLVVFFDGRHFRILDGEKRWRALKMIGAQRVRVVVVDLEG